MSDRIDRATRLIPADPARVFAAWTDAGALARWLPPEDATAEIVTLDCCPGGALKMVLHFAPGTAGKAGPARDEVNGTFTAVDAPRSLTLAVTFPSDDPAYSGTMHMHWTFDPEGPATRTTVAVTDVPPGIDPDVHEAALASSLSKLAALFD